MSEFKFWSACKIADAIATGELTSTAVVESCIEQIKKVNPSINAVVQLAQDRAMKEAQQCDALTKKGESKGPLHGVPITLKDSIDTEGIVSTGGTMGRKNHIPDVDAPVAARLRKAGAVLLGKTNTPELTLSGETNNLIYGRTKNPYDLERSPGGSSGGSAAIIASGGAALELGSDTGGSVREPAHLCGITGIKPTTGRTPRTGHIVPYGGGVLDSLTQIGPMARYVEDLTLALPIICGPDGEDPSCIPVSMGNPDHIDVKQLRIAWYADNELVTPDANIVRVVKTVADALQQEGFNIQHALLPGMKNLVSLSTQLRESANAGLILRLLEKYGTQTPGPDLEGYLVDAESKIANGLNPVLLEKIDMAKSNALLFMQQYDAILCPPSHAIPRPHGTSYGDSFNDWSYMTIHNLLGWPGVSVRAGTSEVNHLPVGVQIVAAPWREDICLALASRIEKMMGGYSPPKISKTSA